MTVESRIGASPNRSSCAFGLVRIDFALKSGHYPMGQFEVDLIGQTIDGRYRVESRIGTGGMGAVWRAQHIQTLQHFAIKTLRLSADTPEGAVQRCLKEARAAAALRSRHVVRVTDVQPDYRLGDLPLPYLVMELLEGVDFESVLERRKTLLPGEVQWVLSQLCRGIQTAHDSGIVHRDLKPANLFLAKDEEGASVVKICDFGLAKLAPVGPESDGLTTETGIIVGTPRYMAPEQLRGTKRVSTATDQWAIGLIAYRLLTGSDYFEGSPNAVELSLRIVHDELPAPSRCSALVPRSFDEWFFRSCARVPEHRYRSVQAQAEALIGVLGEPIPVELSGLQLNATRSLRPVSLVESLAATAACESEQSRHSARNLYVALGICAGLGILGTSTIGMLRPFRVAPTSASRESVAASAMMAATQRPPTRRLGSGQTPVTPTAPVETKLPGDPAWSSSDAPPSASLRIPARPANSTRSVGRIRPTSASALRANQGLAPGSACVRSSECASHLCLAETCR